MRWNSCLAMTTTSLSSASSLFFFFFQKSSCFLSVVLVFSLSLALFLPLFPVPTSASSTETIQIRKQATCTLPAHLPHMSTTGPLRHGLQKLRWRLICSRTWRSPQFTSAAFVVTDALVCSGVVAPSSSSSIQPHTFTIALPKFFHVHLAGSWAQQNAESIYVKTRCNRMASMFSISGKPVNAAEHASAAARSTASCTFPTAGTHSFTHLARQSWRGRGSAHTLLSIDMYTVRISPVAPSASLVHMCFAASRNAKRLAEPPKKRPMRAQPSQGSSHHLCV